jgi:hypothetical protein
MPDVPYSIRDKIEAAVKAYLVHRIAAAGANVLTGVDIRLTQEVTDLKFPRIVIECVRAPAFEDMNTLYMCDLMVAMGTLATETDSAVRHATRVGLLSEWLADRTAYLAYVNSVTPPVPDLIAYDILLQEEQGEQTGQHWLDVLSYLAPAQLRSS